MGDVRFGWFIPTAGDTAAFGSGMDAIPPSLDHFVKVARAAEAAGMEYALVPVQTACYEAWVTTAMVSAQTTSLTMLVAARPGLIAPTVTAKMVSTFDRLSGGRVSVNLIAGGSTDEMAADGVFLSHDERYEVMDETVTIMKAVWAADHRIDFEGKHFTIRNALVRPKPVQQPHPPFYLGGRSPAAKDVCAKHADVYLFWGDTPERIEQEIAGVRALARGHGREDGLRFGMRFQVLVRETEKQAWRDAAALIEGTPDSADFLKDRLWDQSDAQARVHQLLRESESDGLRIHPHLWTGVARLRPGAGITIVGDPDQVAATIREYVELGCTEFCLSGYPHDAEAERFGRLVMPAFRPGERGPGEAATAAGSPDRAH